MSSAASAGRAPTLLGSAWGSGANMIERVLTGVMVMLSLLLLLNEDMFFSSSSAPSPSAAKSTSTSSKGGVAEQQLHRSGEVSLATGSEGKRNPTSIPVSSSTIVKNSVVTTTTTSSGTSGSSLSAGGTESPPQCPRWNRTQWALPPDFDPAAFCATFGEPALPPNKRPRIFYGIMFGYEFDMLEVVLHETFPLVDKYILAESVMTHSLRRKELHYGDVLAEPRFQPYLSKIVNYTFYPRGKIRSGWEIERRQRKFGIKGAFNSSIRNGDVMIGNMDLDELFQASYLMRLKYCKPKTFHFIQFHFRYHLNCMQVDKWSENRDVNFYWGADSVTFKDLYKARSSRRAQEMDPKNYSNLFKHFDGRVNWHLGTFGTIAEVMRKLQNSPHRFLANGTEARVVGEIAHCQYGTEQKWPIPQKASQLPKFIQQNMCIFKHKGWLPGEVTDD